MTPKEKDAVTVKAKISHYWPAWGGPNCARFVGGECLSRMASGKKWQDFIDRAAACPSEYPFGTRFTLPDGSEWVCLDRGGAIVTDHRGVIWLDLLTKKSPWPYGTIVEAAVFRP